MKFWRNLFELYISSSIHVALAVTAFALVSILELELLPDWDLLFFIFFGTITGYNFVKYSGIAQLHHLSLTRNLRLIQLFSLLCFFILIYFISRLSLRTIIAAGIFGILTLFYAVPLLGGRRNLRNLAGIKIFVIALVWAGTTVLLPAVEAEKIISFNLILDFIQRLMLVIALTLPFEIRDLKFDEKRLGTIPQRLGVPRTKILGTLFFVVIFFIELLQQNFDAADFLALTSTVFLGGAFLWRAGRDQGKFYSSFWVEGVPVLYLFAIWLLRHYF